MPLPKAALLREIVSEQDNSRIVSCPPSDAGTTLSKQARGGVVRAKKQAFFSAISLMEDQFTVHLDEAARLDRLATSIRKTFQFTDITKIYQQEFDEYLDRMRENVKDDLSVLYKQRLEDLDMKNKELEREACTQRASDEGKSSTVKLKKENECLRHKLEKAVRCISMLKIKCKKTQ
jgi:hypothetical protein